MDFSHQDKRRSRQLVVLQQSPFCNIDCHYCYLPFRNRKDRMPMSILKKTYERVFASNLIRDPITFLWHAGEPLAVGHDFFEDAFRLCHDVNKSFGRKYHHSIQTNATLIDDRWVGIFKDNNVGVGVSLDGPKFIHDHQRVMRNGRGTHDLVMNGVKKLQAANVDFSVIMVLTRDALDYPNEIYEFFVTNRIRHVGFNIDELEGVHTTSSYQSHDAADSYFRFMKSMLRLCFSNPGQLIVREFKSLVPVVAGRSFRRGIDAFGHDTNVPMQILTIDYEGNYSTFSPELRSAKSEKHMDFRMGNVNTDVLDEILNNPVFMQVNEEIQAGVKKCQVSCGYWDFCGGGPPVNKYFEHGRFDVTETMDCKVSVQTLTDAIITHLETLKTTAL